MANDSKDAQLINYQENIQEHLHENSDVFSAKEDNDSTSNCNVMPITDDMNCPDYPTKEPELTPKKKLPDLPTDLEPLKRKCTTMSQDVLHLLCQKIKEDINVSKEKKDNIRTQQLRELSWKVTDMLALGSSAVKEIEHKSAYQLQRERESKRYQNRRNKKWVQQNVNNDDSCVSRFQDSSNREVFRNRHNKSTQRSRGGRRNNNVQRECDINNSWRKNCEIFDNSAATRFCKRFVQKIISNSINIIIKDENEVHKHKVYKNIAVTNKLVDSILFKSIDVLIGEAAFVNDNLSLTETELLRDMLEESFCSEESSILMNVANELPIKSEPFI